MGGYESRDQSWNVETWTTCVLPRLTSCVPVTPSFCTDARHFSRVAPIGESRSDSLPHTSSGLL